MCIKGQSIYTENEKKRVMAIEQLCRRNGFKPGVPFVREFLREGNNKFLTNAQILEEIKASGRNPSYSPYETIPEEREIFEIYQKVTGHSVNAYQIFKKRLKEFGIRLNEENIEILSLLVKKTKKKSIFRFIRFYHHLFYWEGTRQPLELFIEVDKSTKGLISKGQLIKEFRKISSKDIVEGEITFKEVESLVKNVLLIPNCYNL